MICQDKSRWAHFAGHVDNSSISSLAGHIVELTEKNTEDAICLFLSSCGGDSVPGFSFFEFMTKVLKPNLQTVATGEVGSISLLMYMAGRERFATRNSTFFLHEFGLTFSKKRRVSLSEAKAKTAELEIDQDKYISIISGATNGKLTPAGLRGMMERETTLTAEQAVELGIAHHILD